MQVTTLLRCGALAGPLYLTVGFAQALTRDGFDMRVHALSVLSNGALGWIQILNFLVSGCLVIAGALGVRGALASERSGRWGPVLLAVYGVGLLGAGVFVADPAPGFPPGAPAPAGITTRGMLHFVFGGMGFYTLIAASFVFARRFMTTAERSWAWLSVTTGILFFGSFAFIAAGSTSPTALLLFHAAVVWVWLWHCALHLKLARERSERAVVPAFTDGRVP